MTQSPSTFHSCLELFSRQPGRYTAVAILPYATLHPALLIATWLLASKNTGRSVDLRTMWTSMTFTDKLEFDGVFLLWMTVPFAVAGLGLCRMAADQIAGRIPPFRQSVQDMLVFIPSAFLLGAIVAVAGFVGACFLVIPGFIAVAAFSLVVPAAAVERIGPFAALRRGLSLVFRVFGRVLVLFLVYGFFIIAVFILQALLLAFAPQVLFVRAPIFVFCMLLAMVPLALLNIYLTLLFLEARTAPALLAVPT